MPEHAHELAMPLARPTREKLCIRGTSALWAAERPRSASSFHRPAELFNGRLAMLGFVLAVVTEWLTGQGALGQLHGLIPEGIESRPENLTYGSFFCR